MKHVTPGSAFALALALGLAACATTTSEPPETPDEVARYGGVLEIAPRPLALADTYLGCLRSASLRITTSAADREVRVTDVALPSDTWSLSSSPPWTISAAGPRSLELIYVPQAAGRVETSIRFATDEPDTAPLDLPIRVRALQAEPKPSDMGAVEPLDLVFILDVSTTMDEMAALRGAIEDIFDFVRANSLDVRFGLTTFENEVVVHRRGEFLDREAFFAELDSQLVEGAWVPNPELPRQLLNFDFPENILDALYFSTTDFRFREGARRYFLLMTDASFLEPPSTFSDGTPVLHSYAEVRDALAGHQVKLFSVHASGHGAGLSSAYRSQDPLVEASEGSWFNLSDVSRGRLTLDTLLGDLVMGQPCT